MSSVVVWVELSRLEISGHTLPKREMYSDFIRCFLRESCFSVGWEGSVLAVSSIFVMMEVERKEGRSSSGGEEGEIGVRSQLMVLPSLL